MAVVPILVTIFSTDHPDLVKRELREATTAGYRAMGQLWAGPLLEEHFTPQARLKFVHTPRTPAYLRRKRALAAIGIVEDGGEVDIVFSGATRRAAQRAKYAIRASHDKVEIPIVGPNYYPARNRRRINLGRELMTVPPSHEKQLSAAATQGFSRRLAQIRATRVFRTRGGGSRAA